ncbi:family with sequence similarity 86 member B1 [Homo sapiens]|uniref:Family with sequence similarity 86 member B1 n=1 Tax=Homo sapiens TaxID=9606 RepID=E9PRJ7_HUMAN|nr:family with sequence similarity 86 member B1 [Homo sapiens]KAI4009589.1 family with sequence similarity 86 member B1 [Homo sapiens]
MAPEENAGTELLLQGFERRFLAVRTLRSFPWQAVIVLVTGTQLHSPILKSQRPQARGA